MEKLAAILLCSALIECKGEDTVKQTAGDVRATEGNTVTLGCNFDIFDSLSVLVQTRTLGSMNSIKPERSEEHVAEGRNISLTCKYEGTIYNIQWYRQYQRSRPEFLLYITEAGVIHPTESDFSAHIDKTEKRVDLEIISAAVTDSAVYYCALTHKCKGVDTVTQPAGDVRATEGGTVTLGCKFQTSTTAYLFWYKQEVNGYPKYMLRRYSATGVNAAEFQKDRFDATLNKTSVPLQISSAAVTDSAVYYCALSPQ
ncbi:hypothetical protein F7725_010809 [Dissostichus mawsoni]|uniref:Ig-like domain-containing protein n=1 Tax=Dissostichus mawsoni TaxID=36200 RepID=A0A7J5ZB55_DISMA|nr:hypothetical protein F7725_010809 [Dissostichus mawsoni]